MSQLPAISPGKRAIAAGRTGAGKSSLAQWLLLNSPGHWLILNPKWTKAFDNLPDAKVIEGIELGKIKKSLSENRFTIVNPYPAQSSPETLDMLIQWLHESYTDIGLCIDESYAVHNGYKAGPGLTGWLTRGRELKQSLLALTQRPAWLSKFLFSEADYICGMALNLEDDRKRMFEFTGRQYFKQKIPEYQWLWYDVAKDDLTLYPPVPLN